MLIKCPECGNEISDTCESCPHCGFKFKNESNGVLENESFVARRSMRPGSIRGVAIFDIAGGIFLGLLGLGGIIGYILSSKSGVEPDTSIMFLIMGIFFLLTMVLAIAGGVSVFIRADYNGKVKEDLITYTAGSDVFEAVDFKGRHKTIKVVDYYDIKCNMMTDNVFILSYKDENGRIKKLQLGYCENREEAKRFFSKLAREKRLENNK